MRGAVSEFRHQQTCIPLANERWLLVLDFEDLEEEFRKTNSLEEKSRLVSAFKEKQSSKNLLSCENSDRDGRFRRTETDFSNLFARDLLPAKNGEEQTVQFLLEVVDILLNYVRKTFDRSTKVLDFHHPHQLLEGMEGFNLELSDHPESLEQILVDCRDTLKYGVRTGKGESWVDSGEDIKPVLEKNTALVREGGKVPSERKNKLGQ
ncbi:glutamate decarboxylase gad1 [Saguinus oedipus]|uniref:Glutamate decarboxylase gad1 n=1 Tax=Saguinus oedipus TaxID=9490 RepID=A0ABQ9VHK6_SAGOE|nr:glutamate decarboxylase gad1 [Saguinus oedipus]